jgi:hypothetical protein
MSGQVMSGKASPGQVRLGMVRLGMVRLGMVRLGMVRSGMDRLTDYFINFMYEFYLRCARWMHCFHWLVFVLRTFIAFFAVVKAVTLRALLTIKPFILVWDWVLTTDARISGNPVNIYEINSLKSVLISYIKKHINNLQYFSIVSKKEPNT